MNEFKVSLSTPPSLFPPDLQGLALLWIGSSKVDAQESSSPPNDDIENAQLLTQSAHGTLTGASSKRSCSSNGEQSDDRFGVWYKHVGVGLRRGFL